MPRRQIAAVRMMDAAAPAAPPVWPAALAASGRAGVDAGLSRARSGRDADGLAASAPPRPRSVAPPGRCLGGSRVAGLAAAGRWLAAGRSFAPAYVPWGRFGRSWFTPAGFGEFCTILSRAALFSGRAPA